MMGLFDSLKGALESEALPALLNTVLAQTQYHDLNGLVAALQKRSRGPQVQSWLGNGQTLAPPAGQRKPRLVNARLQAFARRLVLASDESPMPVRQYTPALVGNT